MYLQLAYQWLQSNGYIMHKDLYFIRKFSKTNPPLDMELIYKNNIFEIYYLRQTPLVTVKKEKVIRKTKK